ncbi:MAG: hypothetical protein R2839_10430 [Thermomicrobiales bacterium]
MDSPLANGAAAQPRPKEGSAFDVLDDLLGPAPTVEPRQMFGHFCYAVAGKPFACVVDDGIALKLPASVIDSLDDPEIGPFAPYQQTISGWVLIRRPDGTFAQDGDLIELSLLVSSEAAAGLVRP